MSPAELEATRQIEPSQGLMCSGGSLQISALYPHSGFSIFILKSSEEMGTVRSANQDGTGSIAEEAVGAVFFRLAHRSAFSR